MVILIRYIRYILIRCISNYNITWYMTQRCRWIEFVLRTKDGDFCFRLKVFAKNRIWSYLMLFGYKVGGHQILGIFARSGDPTCGPTIFSCRNGFLMSVPCCSLSPKEKPKGCSRKIKKIPSISTSFTSHLVTSMEPRSNCQWHLIGTDQKRCQGLAVLIVLKLGHSLLDSNSFDSCNEDMGHLWRDTKDQHE